MEFTNLENTLRMALEEAGEENVAALLNAVNCPGGHGLTSEVDEFRKALARLAESGFLEVARLRDETTSRWIPLPQQESLARLRELDSLLRWSNVERLWIWSSPSPRLEVLLTAAGIIAAREALSQHGWPG
jgi:hypothetical protein